MISNLSVAYRLRAEHYDKLMAEAREVIELDATPVVREMAMALKQDCRTTKFGLMIKEETKRSVELEAFIKHMREEHDIPFHFIIADGEFRWID